MPIDPNLDHDDKTEPNCFLPTAVSAAIVLRGVMLSKVELMPFNNGDNDTFELPWEQLKFSTQRQWVELVYLTWTGLKHFSAKEVQNVPTSSQESSKT